MVNIEPFAQNLAAPNNLAFDNEDVLFITETGKGCVTRCVPKGSQALFIQSGAQPAGLAFDDSGDFFVAVQGRHHLLLVSPDKEMEIYATKCQGQPFARPQDMYFSPTGNLLFTDRGQQDDQPQGAIYSVDVNGETRKLADGLVSPYGLTIAADAYSLMVAESGLNRIVSMGLAEDDSLEDKEVFIEFSDGGPPRSLLFDTEGVLYVTREGIGLSRIDPDGKIIETIPLPGNNPCGMTFSGLEYNELYIAESSTGGVYRIVLEHSGQRPFVGPRAI
jgi:sugar lactone lactonase YvrE